jgi:tetratricopeptide (TPR) repeat protein
MKLHREAAGYYRKAIELKPDFEQAMIDLGLSLEGEGLYEEASGIYREVISVNPANIPVTQHLIQLYIQQQNFAEALALLKTLPDQGLEGKEIHRKMGLIYLELEQYDEAIREFNTILAQEPEADTVRLYLGTAYSEKKDYKKAIEEFGKIPKTSPVYYDAVGQTAFLYKEQGNPERGIAMLKEAIAEKPDKAELHLYLSGIHESLEKPKEALKVLTDVEDRFPKDPAIKFRIAVLYDKIGNRNACIARLKQVLALAPEDAQALNYLGYTYAEMGIHLDEALGYLKKAVSLRPDDGFILDSLGWVYFKMKRYDAAIAKLEEAVKLADGDATIVEHLGDAYAAKRDHRRALAAYQRVLKIDPGNKAVSEKIRKLKAEMGGR